MNRTQRRQAGKTPPTDPFSDALLGAFKENRKAVDDYLSSDRKGLLLIAPRGCGVETTFPQPAQGRYIVADISVLGAQAIAQKTGWTERVVEPDPGHYGVVVILPNRRYFAVRYFPLPA